MALEWYFQRGGRWFGPFSGLQLQELAAAGRLQDSDPVRRGANGKAAPADKVKGLLGNGTTKPRTTPPPLAQEHLQDAEQDAGPMHGAARSPVRSRKMLALAAVAGGGLLVLGVLGLISGPASRQDAAQNRGADMGRSLTKLRPEQARLVADIEAKAPPLPDFPEDDYKHDFTKDDYTTTPAGAKGETRTEVLKSEDVEINGKPEMMQGYVERSGKFVPHGAFTTWTDETKMKKLREGKMLNGQRHGITSYYHPNGKRHTEMPYVNGKRHGIGRGWHENGQPHFENHWIAGQFHGRRRNWYDDGGPETDETWVRGNLHGLAKQWFKDGRLASIACYLNGKRHGKVWSQNEDGSPGETGEWEEGKPKGRCRFLFFGPDKQRYYVEVSDEEWKGGTTAEFIARMYYFSLRDRPDLALQFDPKLKVATYVAANAVEFFARFGKPAQEATDLEKAPARTPGYVRDRYQIWSYRCRDGMLRLHAQPTQSGNVMVTAHWRDNPP